jgi:RNA recognition motif-containing protein
MWVGAHKGSLAVSRSDLPSRDRPIEAPRCECEAEHQDNPLSKKLYVGNIPFSTTEAELRDLFGRHGSVESVKVITDRETGRPRGFAFVEMAEGGAAQDAIRALDGTDFGGRTIKVNEAQDKPSRGGRF